MAGVDFILGREDELIEQVVGFDAEAFAARDLDVGTRLVFVAERVAEFGGAARRERDHLVGEMGVVIGGFVMAESAEGFDYRVLRFGLAGVGHLVGFCGVARGGGVPLPLPCRKPAINQDWGAVEN